MKKALSAIVSLFMVLSLAACGNSQPAASVAPVDNTSSSLVISASSSDAEAVEPQSSAPDAVDPSAPEQSASSAEPASLAPESGGNVLIAYFSLGRNTANPDSVDATASASLMVDGGSRYGTTEYVARLIQQQVGGDLHSIQVQQPYPTDFDAVVDRNHEEANAGTLPALTGEALDVSQYDTVFLGYPVWATTVPQAILSFLSQYDLSGKTIVPFCTHDGYGAGSSYRNVTAAAPQATVLDGIAIDASDVPGAADMVAGWLREIGMSEAAPAQAAEAPITITIGDTVLDGVLYDTELADEIRAHFPLSVSMGSYGGREYYGGIDFTPANVGAGQLTFENGHITYCGRNNTMAIFYAQTDSPILTMEIIPIGRVTSDLAVFDELPGSVNITFALAE